MAYWQRSLDWVREEVVESVVVVVVVVEANDWDETKRVQFPCCCVEVVFLYCCCLPFEPIVAMPLRIVEESPYQKPSLRHFPHHRRSFRDVVAAVVQVSCEEYY